MWVWIKQIFLLFQFKNLFNKLFEDIVKITDNSTNEDEVCMIFHLLSKYDQWDMELYMAPSIYKSQETCNMTQLHRTSIKWY